MSEKILIIDGLGIFFASYAADPSINANGEHIGGTKGFLKQLQRACREINPSQVFIVWDGQGGSDRRKSLNKSYKEGRKAVNPFRYNRASNYEMTPEEMAENKSHQLRRLVEYLNCMPVKQFVSDGVEADDIISFLVNMGCLEDYVKIVMSNDKDFYQLLNDKMILYRPATKRYVTKKDLIDEEGIHPENMTMVRAICGDKSDNLIGVHGIGPKTLIKHFPLLREEKKIFVDDLIDQVRNMKSPPKLLEKIKESREDIILNYKIMQLYDPVLTKDSVDKLEELACNEEPTADWTQISSMMIEDGLGVTDWSSLRITLKNIVENK